MFIPVIESSVRCLFENYAIFVAKCQSQHGDSMFADFYQLNQHKWICFYRSVIIVIISQE